MKKDKLVVCSCVQDHQAYHTYWKDFELPFTYMCDVTKDPSFDSHGINYREQEIRDQLYFEGDIPTTHPWNHQGRNIVWFYAFFRMSLFYLQNPGFKNYWFMDNDVKIGKPTEFFKGFDKNDADFISYYVFKEKTVQSQPNIPHIDDKTTSKDYWFQRFPHSGDILSDNVTEYFGSFFPIVRFSNKMLNALTSETRMGFTGYSEGWVPTMVNHMGGKLDTVFNNQGKSDHFNQDEVKVTHKNINIDWSWI